MKHRQHYDAYTRDVGQPYGVGDKISFEPICFTRSVDCCYLPINLTLHGEVVYVNAEHRYYTAEAICNGHVIRESYKF